MAMSQEECCKTVRLSVRVKEGKRNIRWRGELRHQSGPMDHPTQQEIGVPATESEEDRATATLCLSLDAIRAGVETTIHVADRALAVRGGDETSTQPQAQQTSKVGRLKQTSRRGRSEGANQDEKTTKHTAIARGL